MSAEIAQALLEIGAIGFSPNHPITFKSGILSPIYVDNRRLPYHPTQWRIVIEGFQHLLESQDMEFDVIAGVAVGGVPHSSALAYAMQKPSVFVRKEAKGHGKGQRIEGGDISSKRVILIEDLVTTGASSLSGISALRKAGATVDYLLAIVSYEFTEAIQHFKSADVHLHTLTTFSTILEIAQNMNLFTDSEARLIHDWFNDPNGWGARHDQ